MSATRGNTLFKARRISAFKECPACMQAIFAISKNAKKDDSRRMNSLYSALSGLLASLLLSLGFSRLAARFDQLNQTSPQTGDQHLAAIGCLPCRWQQV